LNSSASLLTPRVEASSKFSYNLEMAFAEVPQESKNQINKAGEALSRLTSSPAPDKKEFAWAWNLTFRWRVCHAYPINTFQATLRNKLKNGYPEKSNAAQRLKRMPTIIDKLGRYPAMQLTTMQDIAGVRAMLPSVAQAERLAEEYRNSNFLHELIDEKDYIKDPRDEDGYRSIHLIYRYKNKRNPHYDGLRLELQIRSRLQHIWATAVETMGTFLGQALKSRQGDRAWIDFFALVSAAFAHIERRPPPPRFNKLSIEQTNREIVEAEKSLQALEMMQGFSVAADVIIAKGKSYYYHLIILDSLKHTVEVLPYSRKNFKEAVLAWDLIEKEVAGGRKVEPVLVSAGTLFDTKRAYPNFFLDIGEFDKIVRKIVSNTRT